MRKREGRIITEKFFCNIYEAGAAPLRVVEANPLLLGGLPAGLAIVATGRNQRLGDLAAGTLVVSVR